MVQTLILFGPKGITQILYLLTKLIEIQAQIPNLRLYVSTRQPHLLRAFQQDFGVYVDFNNERIVAECDLVFLTLLPFQAPQVLKDVRNLAHQRALLFTDPHFGQPAKLKQTSALSLMKHHLTAHAGLQISGTDKIPPLFVSCLAATSVPKLRQMLCETSAWVKTQVNVPKIKGELFKSRQELLLHSTSDQNNNGGQTPDSNNQEQFVKKSNPSFQRVISQKAFQFGADSGVTAEFIVKQAAQQLAPSIDDFEALISHLQVSLYAQVMTGAVRPMGACESGSGQLAGVKEAIVRAMLGGEYRQMQGEKRQEWISGQFVLDNFYQLFEDRIKYLFLVNDSEQQ